MADASVGIRDSLSENSLQHYNEEGVLSVLETFYTAIHEFQRLTKEIFSTRRDLTADWKGPAKEEFSSKFLKIFEQVKDIGEALGTIYDTLNKAQLEFYWVDYEFANQLKEAAAKSAEGGKKAGKGNDITYENQVGECYVPNMVYRPLPAKPVLVSTMGSAYTPDLSYVAMSPRPVLNSCLPSPLMVVLTYASLIVKDEIEHRVGNAIEVLLDHAKLPERENLSSTTGGATVADVSLETMTMADSTIQTLDGPYTPNLDYTVLPLKEELASTIGSAYIPNLEYVRLQLRNLISSGAYTLAAAVTSALATSYSRGEQKPEIITRIGEAVMNVAGGTYGPEDYSILVQNIGTVIYNDLYGGQAGSTGGTQGLGLAGVVDAQTYADTVHTLISDTLVNHLDNSAALQQTDSSLLLVGGYTPPAHSNVVSIISYDVPPLTLQSTEHICQPEFLPSSIQSTDVPVLLQTMNQHANQWTVEQTVLNHMSEIDSIRYRAAAANPTMQRFAGDNLVITIEAPDTTGFGSVVSMGKDGVDISTDFIVDCVDSIRSQGVVPSFDHLAFPIPI